jgi:hypothetical protein
MRPHRLFWADERSPLPKKPKKRKRKETIDERIRRELARNSHEQSGSQ